ncbi:hypothetical protein PoB_003131300 [Plakobranchus ocellatus]|uniref:Uncharacterized protein n=1 Tax=Plakobranchus ocellatus TaxID=259542 RepID=A0AAV4AC18_9GAST|nr:hypothetical protein PoB_003131300 [Plakobranchus ocellatus]
MKLADRWSAKKIGQTEDQCSLLLRQVLVVYITSEEMSEDFIGKRERFKVREERNVLRAVKDWAGTESGLFLPQQLAHTHIAARSVSQIRCNLPAPPGTALITSPGYWYGLTPSASFIKHWGYQFIRLYDDDDGDDDEDDDEDDDDDNDDNDGDDDDEDF